MNTFEVNNEIELGNAIWSSQAGDNIILKSGEYGNISIKDGVNYEFDDNATAADILGLGIRIGDGQLVVFKLEIFQLKIQEYKKQTLNYITFFKKNYLSILDLNILFRFCMQVV